MLGMGMDRPGGQSGRILSLSPVMPYPIRHEPWRTREGRKRLFHRLVYCATPCSAQPVIRGWAGGTHGCGFMPCLWARLWLWLVVGIPIRYDIWQGVAVVGLMVDKAQQWDQLVRHRVTLDHHQQAAIRYIWSQTFPESGNLSPVRGRFRAAGASGGRTG